MSEDNGSNYDVVDVDASAGRVSPYGVIAIVAYLMAVALTLLYCIFQVWPEQSGQGVGTPIQVRLFGIDMGISSEQRLLMIVIMGGALGSIVAALRSLYWYIGNRNLVWSWLPMYILRPLVGATLSLVFYLVIRGGFFAPGATVQDTSPFGFAALAALVGLFSEQAVLKLKNVAEELFTPPLPGMDHAKEG